MEAGGGVMHESFPAMSLVFIGHSNHDCGGAFRTFSIRGWTQGNIRLSGFLNVHDVPPGQSFRDVLLRQIGASVTMVAPADSHASRKRCREVTKAKRWMRPIVVHHCIQDHGQFRISATCRRFTTIVGCPLDMLCPVGHLTYRYGTAVTEFSLRRVTTMRGGASRPSWFTLNRY